MAHLFNLKPRGIKMTIFEFWSQHICRFANNLNIFHNGKIQNPIFYETLTIITINKLLNIIDGIQHVFKPPLSLTRSLINQHFIFISSLGGKWKQTPYLNHVNFLTHSGFKGKDNGSILEQRNTSIGIKTNL